MMTVQMNSLPSSPPPREFAETLHQKNIELEKSLRKSAQSKIPSNPSTWLEMRENFEGIILADHDFAQKHDTETALWQLHYKRIEEFRAHIKSASISSAQTQGSTKTSTNANSNANTERVKRIKSSFKVFLSESTGYYHELMLKIRSKYGLPLGYFSEGPECKIDPVKDEKEMKKGLLSCHKCLIYLGDLARYKGLYGEGDSIEREFSAANSYYLQAVSLYPANGNPHHQLGLLANYSHNELLLVYRYFRSLTVEFPFMMARENLVVAFEKNRQLYIQLASNKVPKETKTKAGPTRSSGKLRGKGEKKSPLKESKTEQVSNKESEFSVPEVFKNFCVRFVRLNGILFTRTSLETFDEVSSSLMADFQTLLSSGSEEQLNFGPNYTENALLILRLISMLIFTIHNSKRDSENQSYAEIVQRTLLLKHAFNFSFEFVGFIIKRCSEVKDISSSFYMNAILVYLEWLACHMDITTGTGIGTETDEKQADVRCFFWNQFVHLMNKLVQTGLASFEGDKDKSCFFEMSKYEEGETGNRLALWEDFELRGFLPLLPAQVILDFSRKSDGGLKEKKFRVQRIFAAGRALMNVVQIGPNKIYFDQGVQSFVICKNAPELLPPLQIGPETIQNGIKQENHISPNMPVLENLEEDDDDDEVIVFQPIEKSLPSSNPNALPNPSDDFLGRNIIPNPNNDNFMGLPKNPKSDDFMDRNIQMSGAGWINTISAPLNNHQLQSIFPDNGLDLRNSIAKMPPINNWVSDQEAFLSTGLNNFTISGNRIPEQRSNNFLNSENENLDQRNSFSIPEQRSNNFLNSENGNLDQRNSFLIPEQRNNNLPFPSHIPSPPPGFMNTNNNNHMISNGYMHQMPFSSQIPTSGNMLTSSDMSAGMNIMPSLLDFGVPAEGLGTRFMNKLPVPVPKKNPNPVGRPIRHVGPPPGFNAPMKRLDETLNYQNTHPSHTNEYGYLNPYQPVQNHGTSNQIGYNNYMNFSTGAGTSMEMFGTGFGYPNSTIPVSGTQAPQPVKDFQLFESSEPNNSNNNNGQQQENLQNNSLWSGHYFV